MENPGVSFEEFNYAGVQEQYSFASKGLESVETENIGKEICFDGGEFWGETGGFISFCSDNGLYQDHSLERQFVFSKCQQQPQQQQSFSGYGLFDDLNFGYKTSTPIQTCLEEMTKFDGILATEPQKEKRSPFSVASLELLKNYGNGFKRLTGDRITKSNNNETCTKVENRKLSTEEIIRFAAGRFIQFASQGSFSMFNHSFNVPFSSLSTEEINDVELAEFLLAAAEKVGYQQYERATRLLNQCDYLSSNTGNPVERLVYYFSEALRERIDRETGRVTLKGLGKKQSFNIEEASMSPSSSILAWHKEVPFFQVSHFTGIQAIVENVAEATRIHIIDLAIRNGVQWTVLMQALVSRSDLPVEFIKITAIGTTRKDTIEDTGKRLKSFAETLNLPFIFKIVMVRDMQDLKEELLEIDPEEAVAVFAEYVLRTMLSLPNRLDSTMRVIRNINPCIVVVTEIEANQNSPWFVNRFVESVFFFSAYFDCLEACMTRDDPNRMITESVFFSQGIRNIVAAEGQERNIRSVNINVWRSFFARFQMEEVELSSSSLYQADLVLQNFDSGRSCTLDLDGKSLLIGWKGTPIHSLSIWKFF